MSLYARLFEKYIIFLISNFIFLTLLYVVLSLFDTDKGFLFFVYFLLIILIFLMKIYINSEKDIFDPFYMFVFIYIILFFMRPAYILLEEDYAFINLIGVDYKSFFDVGILYSIVALFFFFIGNMSKTPRKTVEKYIRLFIDLKTSINQFGTRTLLIYSLLFCLVGLTTYFYFYGKNLAVSTSVDIFRESTAYIYYGLDLLIPAVVIALILKNKNKSIIYKIYFWSLLAFTIYIYMQLHARYRWVALLIVLISTSYLLRKKRPSIINVIMFSVVSMILFAIFGIYRGGVEVIVQNPYLIKEALISFDVVLRFLSSKGDAAMFDFFLLIIQEVPNNIDYLYGMGFLQLFIHPIPRLIWPSKPVLPSAQLMENVLPEFFERGTGFASSIIADFYWNFGFIGLVIGPFLFGSILKAVYNTWKKNQNSIEAILLLSFTIAYIPMYLRGEFIGTSAWFLFSYIPLLFAVKSSRHG